MEKTIFEPENVFAVRMIALTFKILRNSAEDCVQELKKTLLLRKANEAQVAERNNEIFGK